MSHARKIGFIGFDGVNAFDLVGPLEVLTTANALAEAGSQPYVVEVLAAEEKAFQAESGLSFIPTRRLAAVGELDTIVIPGGAGLRQPETTRKVAQWLTMHADGIRRISSVCTGIYGLAPTGLLDGRRATTHWRFSADVARQFPSIQLEPDKIYVSDGPFHTSGGISSGIDLALAWVEQDLGSRMALSVAREMVVFLKRSGGQRQYSEPLRFQSHTTEPLANLAAWLVERLHEALPIERLAEQASLSTRQFARAFRAAFQTSPAAYISQLRMDRARTALIESTAPISQIAYSVGYASDDVFRRAFEREFGITPSDYRKRFGQE
ncbi:GlxA family transcriptional regulator [Dyella tabacisoli]|uniref:GlxA family transcriptional regulator n=1 Tax=Dyella tabacisoli TaxID=2282381 RepID=A0A369UP33_9GAMM|nr:GlxA family transcriptional regulator [Dyella tabacisoli]RDD81478.1 GlxA family transcriptional regulator [Dyella tabacisoli]